MKREIKIEIKEDLNHYALIKQVNNRDNEENYGMLIDKDQFEQLRSYFISDSLPDLRECNQAGLDYAEHKNNPDFFLIKQTFKEGINWALNKLTNKQ